MEYLSFSWNSPIIVDLTEAPSSNGTHEMLIYATNILKY